MEHSAAQLLSQAGDANEGIPGFDFWLEHVQFHQIWNKIAKGRGGCSGKPPQPRPGSLTWLLESGDVGERQLSMG